ncbi:hypothetical protein [Anaerobium acetethylicum]|uniref:Uncharacterized protein n=1 Tax=Anaerobium acetethylicum TaxID=1619234 RepID=A0A1D3TXS7_9FIRM|nr:hypothetical protein [Anaerobium acetethylicum]SCP99157.1 hypothetical protein SAMN05421730_103322 [Anaerobium acetethylicum]
MKNWKCVNCNTTIYKCEYDKGDNYEEDLRYFAVYHNDTDLLGKIYPATIEDTQECISALDNHECPICSGWEDGLGNKCNLFGWGDEHIRKIAMLTEKPNWEDDTKEEYYINYNTGGGNFYYEGTLKEAMEAAEEGIAFTGCSISVELNDWEVATLPWYNVAARDGSIVTAGYGDFGHYGEWQLD